MSKRSARSRRESMRFSEGAIRAARVQSMWGRGAQTAVARRPPTRPLAAITDYCMRAVPRTVTPP
eukprot:3112333-Prymnesium_polylepis.1